MTYWPRSCFKYPWMPFALIIQVFIVANSITPFLKTVNGLIKKVVIVFNSSLNTTAKPLPYRKRKKRKLKTRYYSCVDAGILPPSSSLPD